MANDVCPYCQLPHAVCGHLTRLQWRDKLAADYERNHPRPSWRINGERQPYIPEHALGEPVAGGAAEAIEAACVTEAALDALELEIRKLSVMIAALVAIRRELSLDKRTLPRCGKRKKPAAWSRV